MNLIDLFFYRCCKALLPYIALVSFAGFAQQQDTLKNLVQATGPEKITQLEHWCNKKLFLRKPLQKIKLLNELEHIALKENDKITLASIIFYRGLYVMAMDGQQHKQGIALMQKAITMAEKNRQEIQAAYFKHSLGYYYFTSAKNSVEALKNMLQAHYVFDRIGYNKVYNPSGMLDRMGYVYYHLSNFNEANKYFKLSLENPMENSRRHIGILNSIGLSYRELAETDSASKYFQRSRHLAVIARDTAWIGINSGEIGRLYLMHKEYARAKPFMEEFYRCALTVNDTELIVEALTSLGDISLQTGNAGLGLQQLKQAETLLEQAFKSGDMPVQNYLRKQYLFRVFAKAWEANGNTALALDYLKEASKIRDSIERRAILSKNTFIQQMFEAEQANNRLKLLKEEKQAAVMKQKFYIAIGISLAIIIILLYSRQMRERKIRKQKETLLNLEKEKAENELESSRKQLGEYLNNLRQKAELIEKIQSEMDLLRKQHPIPAEDEKVVLQKLSLATILTDDDWIRFRTLFEKAHVGFFLKLKTVYPGLTPAETRLCSLVKLGLNSHQMAAMMGISRESIKKNRQRLRRKINLSKEQKLDKLFINF